MDRKIVSKGNRLHLVVETAERPNHLAKPNWNGTGMALKDWQRSGESKSQFLKRVGHEQN